ncbi:HEAT repeat domain-containing protein [bacterium]|nr:MAG: HEAT repeat domain-containing protein [bacterium]RIK60458.1 MAG: hypothetical protein DCC64_14770 [Planctomycetota bacterium]
MRIAGMLLLIAALVTLGVSASAGNVVPSADVKGDLAKLESYRTLAEKQDERIPLMRQLAASGGNDVCAQFITLLSDEFEHIREEAVELLVELKGQGVDELLLKQGLGSKDAETCRRCIEVLGRRRCESAVSALLSILKGQRENAVRVAAARALERIGSEKARRALLDGLSARGAAGGASAAALGRLGIKDAGSKIERLLADKDGLCTAGAADGLAALGPDEYVVSLCRVADHKDFRARIAVAQALGRLTTGELAAKARGALEDLLEDGDWRVRRRTIEALVDLWQPVCVELLLARLPLEKSGLRYDLVHALEDLTGERKGYTADAWTFYWQQVGAKRGLAERKARPAGGWLRSPSAALVQEAGEGNTTVLFEVPVLNQDCVFVVETTGVMNSPVAGDTRTRFEIAREEMRRTIKGLCKDAHFQVLTYRYVSNVPPFRQRQAAFEKGLAPASPENVALADQWLVKRDIFGLCAWYENIASALDDPRVRAVFFVNSGMLQRGVSVRWDRTRELYLELTRFHPISFVNIGLDMGYQHTLDMQAFVESLGGRFQLAKWGK